MFKDEKMPLLGNSLPHNGYHSNTLNTGDNYDAQVAGMGSKEDGSVISFHEISYTVRTKQNGVKIDKNILNQISGIMKPGVNAILGPTGSGKTTLLDVLAGRKDPHCLTGTVLIDGRLQPENFKCISGYVVQDDVVMGTLTIRENLNFSACLRLPRTLSKKDREQRVNETVRDLGLTEVADQKVGTEFIRGVSGGERKRTSIGMELITSPSVLFLDEPTTGLDASTACTVIRLLHTLGRRGKTIIFSIHQPRYSIFKLFDSMILLSVGDMVYQGLASDALVYFDKIGYSCEAHNNPPDFFMDVINANQGAVSGSTDSAVVLMDSSHQPVRDMVHAYKTSSHAQQIAEEIRPILDEFYNNERSLGYPDVKEVGYATSFLTQLYYVSGRAVKNILRNPQTSVVQMFTMVIFAVIVGAIYYNQTDGPSGLQNRVGAFFFIVMNMVFGNLSAVELFIKERKIFMHESAGGYYRVSAYFLAKVLCDIIPMRLIPISGFSAIVYFMIGFKREVLKFFIFLLTLVLTSLCACGLSFFVSASVETFAIANLLIALPYVFMMVFSGVLVNLGSVGAWLSWIKYISIFRYAVESLEANELEGMVFHCGAVNMSCPTGDEYLSAQGVKPGDLWYNELALGSMTVILLLFAYLSLRLVKKEK
ncbi:broad substrate specificity ATP-binding cassette transporter ABCG2 [Nematostella vectensis]|uniref:broad substrate specificity ATP-binding cassette transporter ABCG2 n=1 Tax=Nematostella vectensis TaxID=45351 RepID=UPI0020775DC3|nr:broad substrate specificity ATP-binding cassette transporter ABCG2 [Nematostella vectensis]